MSTPFPLPCHVARFGGRLAALALVLGSAGTALAQTTPVPSAQGRLTPAQQQRIFPEQKNLLLRDQQARITILQNGERCVAAASTADALRSCMKQERTASQNQRQQFWSGMRSLYQRNGIVMPERGKGAKGPAGNV
jgi:hypothetical protein